MQKASSVRVAVESKVLMARSREQIAFMIGKAMQSGT